MDRVIIKPGQAAITVKLTPSEEDDVIASQSVAADRIRVEQQQQRATKQLRAQIPGAMATLSASTTWAEARDSLVLICQYILRRLGD